MITRIVKLTIQPEKLDEFKAHFFRVNEAIRAFEGCKHLQLLADVDRPGVIFTFSKWESKSYLEAYLNSELLSTTWKLVKPLFNDKAEAWTVAEEVEVK